MRTGSNLLERTLGQLGDTVCYGEAFNPGFISGPRKSEVLGYTMPMRDADPIGFLEHMIAAEPSRIAGFRIFQDHNPKVMEYILRDPRCTRIILTRDLLDSYISLKIARKTDQWMLSNARRRTTAQMRFDAGQFADFCLKRETYLAWLDDQLSANGSDAIRIDYADLKNQTMLQDLASCIGSSGKIPIAAPILRQNPESRAAKVENYAEMCAALGLPVEEIPPEESTGQIFYPHGFGAAYASVPGNALEPMITLLHRIEVRDFGRDRLAPAELLINAHECAIYTSEPPSDLPVITMVSDPFRRLHSIFVNEVFGQGWHFSDVRKALSDRHGEMPPRKGLVNGRAKYPAELHQQHFGGFLDLVAEALQNDDRSSVPPEWRAQAELIDEYRSRTELAQVFKHEKFAEAANWLTDQMGLDRFPRGQINGMRQAGQKSLLPIHDVAVPELTKAVMDLHPEDYTRFGYQQFSTDE